MTCCLCMQHAVGLLGFLKSPTGPPQALMQLHQTPVIKYTGRPRRALLRERHTRVCFCGTSHDHLTRVSTRDYAPLDTVCCPQTTPWSWRRVHAAPTVWWVARLRIYADPARTQPLHDGFKARARQLSSAWLLAPQDQRSTDLRSLSHRCRYSQAVCCPCWQRSPRTAEGEGGAYQPAEACSKLWLSFKSRA